nr:unnamed protein product [Spirometra erinaceieuropaei]
MAARGAPDRALRHNGTDISRNAMGVCVPFSLPNCLFECDEKQHTCTTRLAGLLCCRSLLSGQPFDGYGRGLNFVPNSIFSTMLGWNPKYRQIMYALRLRGWIRRVPMDLAASPS